jgi:hypothetical protein
MGHSINWNNQAVCVDYFGEIDNEEIEFVHYLLNQDERFSDCSSLVLDISKCNMDEVDANRLLTVIATDLGSAFANQSLKVAMVAADPQNIEKACHYISQCRQYRSPWEYGLFHSRDAARSWIEA